MLVRLSQRDIAHTERPPSPQHAVKRRPSMLRRAGSVCQAALAALSVKLQLTCQMLVCFLAVMFLEIAGSSYFALEGRPVWAVRWRQEQPGGAKAELHSCLLAHPASPSPYWLSYPPCPTARLARLVPILPCLSKARR